MKTITEDQIKACFTAAVKQTDYITAIYRLIYPNWDQIESVDGHPRCNSKTAQRICGYCIAWDKANVERYPNGEPKVMPGGAWLNWGFSSSANAFDRCADTGPLDELADWEVEPAPFTLQPQFQSKVA